MAVQPNPYLVMTDGTDTVTFADGAGGVTNYPPVRDQWGPTIAGVRASQLGGRGPYADVQEDILCNIRDTTAALCWSRLDTLSRLLDKAERWWLKNENISPVVLKYAPQGSTIHSNATPMQAIVLGRVGNDELNGVDLPSSVNDAGMLFEIYGVQIKCLRRGAWTGATDTTAASGAFSVGAVMSRTFASSIAINSPLDLTIAGFDKTATPTIKAGYLMVGSSATDINLNSPTGSLVAGWTSVADAANLAMFGNVLRYTPTGTAASSTGSLNMGTPVSGPCAIIAAVRNNSATTSFLLHMNLTGQSGTVSTPDVLIDTSTTNPRLVLLGVVSGTALNNISTTATASAASGTLDINYAYVVNLRDETVNVIAHDDLNVSLISVGAVTLRAQWIPYTDRVPALQAIGSTASPNFTYRGALPFMTTGTNVYAVWVATNANFWLFTNNVNAVITTTLTVTRYRSYLSPQ